MTFFRFTVLLIFFDWAFFRSMARRTGCCSMGMTRYSVSRDKASSKRMRPGSWAARRTSRRLTRPSSAAGARSTGGAGGEAADGDPPAAANPFSTGNSMYRPVWLVNTR